MTQTNPSRFHPLAVGIILMLVALALVVTSLLVLPLLTSKPIPVPVRAAFSALTGLFGLLGALLIVFRRRPLVLRFMRTLERVPLWVIPLCIALLLSPLSTVYTSPDSAWYMANAVNLSTSRGYVDSEGTPVLLRGPGLPALLAGGFKLLGISELSAVAVCRLFFVLTVLVVFFLAQALLDRRAGLICSLLVLSSGTLLRIFADVLPDHVVAFFMLLSLLALLYAFRSRRMWLFFAAGIALGCGFLVKETALAFVPVPWIAVLLVKLPDKRRLVLGSIICTAGFLLAAGPWIGYLAYQGALPLALGTTGSLIGSSSGDQAIAGSSAGVLGLARLLVSGSLTFFTCMTATITLSVGVLLSWILTLISAARRRSLNSVLPISAALTLLPVLVLQGGLGYRLGQSVVFYVLSFAVTSVMIVRIIDLVAEGIESHPSQRRSSAWKLRTTLSALVISVFLCAQLATEGSAGRLLMTARFYATGITEFAGWHDENTAAVGAWLRDRVPTGSPILCDWYLQDSLYFYTSGDLPLVRIPYLVFPQERAPIRQPGIETSDSQAAAFIVLERKSSNASKPIEWAYIRAVRSADIVEAILREEVQYVVLTDRRSYLREWFDERAGFDPMANVGTTAIYRVNSERLQVDSTAEQATPVRIAEETAEFLGGLRKSRPAEYRILVEQFLPLLRVSEDVADSLTGHMLPDGYEWLVGASNL